MANKMSGPLLIPFCVLCWLVGAAVLVFTVKTANAQGLTGMVLLGFVVALGAFVVPMAAKLKIANWFEYERAKEEREKAEAAADDARRAANAVNVARLYHWVASATAGTFRDLPDVRKDLRDWLLRAADGPISVASMKQAAGWGDSSSDSLRSIADGLSEAGILQMTEVQGEPHYQVTPDMKQAVKEAFE